MITPEPQLGSNMFDSVFAEDIRACFRTSLERVSEKEDIGLRIKLQLEQAPELADLPWELLLDDSSDRFCRYRCRPRSSAMCS